MLFLVELDHVMSGTPFTREAGRAFIEQVILPTLAQVEQLQNENTIVAGGPAVGRIALRLMIEAGSPTELDRIVSRLPLWPLSATRVTPLVSLGERRDHVSGLLL